MQLKGAELASNFQFCWLTNATGALRVKEQLHYTVHVEIQTFHWRINGGTWPPQCATSSLEINTRCLGGGARLRASNSRKVHCCWRRISARPTTNTSLLFILIKRHYTFRQPRSWQKLKQNRREQFLQTHSCCSGKAPCEKVHPEKHCCCCQAVI